MWADSTCVKHISERNPRVRPPWVASPPRKFDYLWPQLHQHEQTEMVWNTSKRWMPAFYDTSTAEWRVRRLGIQHMVEPIWTYSQHFARRPQRNDGFPEMNCSLWWDPCGHNMRILQDVRSGMIGFQKWTAIYVRIHVDFKWAFCRTSAAEW